MHETMIYSYLHTMIDKTTFLLLTFLLTLVQGYYVKPLRAGTLVITDAQIRSGRVLNSMIDLKMSRTYHDSHKDIQTIAAITNIAMD